MMMMMMLTYWTVSDAVRGGATRLQSALRVGEGDVKLRLLGQHSIDRHDVIVVVVVVNTSSAVRIGKLSVASPRRARTAHQPHDRPLLGRGRRRPRPVVRRRTGRLPSSGGRARGRRRLPRPDRMPRPGGGRRPGQQVLGPGDVAIKNADGTEQTYLLVGDQFAAAHVLRGRQCSCYSPL